MELHVHALCAHDAGGRLVRANAPGPGPAPAPRFFLGRTRVGALWRFRRDLPFPLVRELARLAAREPPAADLAAEPERWAPMRARLEAHAPVEAEWRGATFRFPEVLPSPVDALRVEALAAAARPAVEAAFPALAPFVGREPAFGVREGGALVALCYCATDPRNAAAVEAGVDTLPAWRGRGLAPRLVAEWARAVRAERRIPLYSSAWSNPASLAVVRKLGLNAYGATLHLR